jgi:glycosyltransferase involved in cell wall biosynthesis
MPTKLVAISRVRNEVDIIEAFVRHHAYYCDKLLILDDGSTDGTYEVLVQLRSQGLPLVVMRERSIGYEQRRYMTKLLHTAVHQFGADWVAPIDADEFIEPAGGLTLADALANAEQMPQEIGWNNFVWRHDLAERADTHPISYLHLRMPLRRDHTKVLVPASIVGPGTELAQGNHSVLSNGVELPSGFLPTVQLCHFPIRGTEQYASKVAIGYLNYLSMPGWDRNIGFHYIEPFRDLSRGLDRLAERMETDSKYYSASPGETLSGDPAHVPFRYMGASLEDSCRQANFVKNLLAFTEAMAADLATALARNEELKSEVGRLRELQDQLTDRNAV